MTREELIRYGKDYLNDLENACCDISDKHMEFVRQSIKALSAEPCCNCIEFKRYAKEMGFEIDQEPCDCISREFIEIVVEYPPADLCTYPEYRGKPYFSIKYREKGNGYVGFGTYKIEMLSQWIKEYFMPSIQPKAKAEWIPVSEGLPEVGQTVRVIDDRGKVFEYELNPLDVDKYTTGKWRFLDHEIIAWQPLQNHTR